jgi:integrase
MASQSITIRTIEASKPCPGRDVYTWDGGLRGFGLRVTPKGVKSYVLQYRVDGGPARRTTIGIHGSPWTTQTARKEAERLLVLTMQRRQEVAEMDWSEIDLEARIWTLPAERAKNDEAHIIPLTDMAIAELKALHPKDKGFVFSTTGTTPVSGYSKAKRLLDEHMLKIMTERLQRLKKAGDKVQVSEWRLHDLDL